MPSCMTSTTLTLASDSRPLAHLLQNKNTVESLPEFQAKFVQIFSSIRFLGIDKKVMEKFEKFLGKSIENVDTFWTKLIKIFEKFWEIPSCSDK